MDNDLHKIKMRERYKKKKIDGTFNDMREQFLKTATQRSHMKRTTTHDREILSKQTKLGMIINKSRETHESNLMDFFNLIKSKPMYTNELNKIYNTALFLKYYKDLRIRGFPIQRTTLFGGRCSSSARTVGKIQVYYTLDKRMEALERVHKDFPQKMGVVELPILDGLSNAMMRQKILSRQKKSINTTEEKE